MVSWPLSENTMYHLYHGCLANYTLVRYKTGFLVRGCVLHTHSLSGLRRHFYTWAYKTRFKPSSSSVLVVVLPEKLTAPRKVTESDQFSILKPCNAKLSNPSGWISRNTRDFMKLECNRTNVAGQSKMISDDRGLSLHEISDGSRPHPTLRMNKLSTAVAHSLPCRLISIVKNTRHNKQSRFYGTICLYYISHSNSHSIRLNQLCGNMTGSCPTYPMLRLVVVDADGIPTSLEGPE